MSECKKQGVEIVVTSTYRSDIEQDLLFLQPYDGKDNDGDGLIDEANEKVTNAKAGQSLHNWRVAFDVVPIVKGKADYSNNALWSKIAQIGHGIGLEAGADWTTFPDKPHFQYTLGHTWQDFKAGRVDLSKFNGFPASVDTLTPLVSKFNSQIASKDYKGARDTSSLLFTELGKL